MKTLSWNAFLARFFFHSENFRILCVSCNKLKVNLASAFFNLDSIFPGNCSIADSVPLLNWKCDADFTWFISFIKLLSANIYRGFLFFWISKEAASNSSRKRRRKWMCSLCWRIKILFEKLFLFDKQCVRRFTYAISRVVE